MKWLNKLFMPFLYPLNLEKQNKFLPSINFIYNCKLLCLNNVFFSSQSVLAQDLVYKPKKSCFWGDTFILSMALTSSF
jgi:hypothetical protein